MGFCLFRGNNMFFEPGQNHCKKSHSTRQALIPHNITKCVILTLKIITLIIRINLLPPRTLQGNSICIFYPSPPANAEKDPPKSMRTTKIWGKALGKKEQFDSSCSKNISLCCLHHGICQKHLLGALQCSCLGPATLKRMSTQEMLAWKFLCTQIIRSRWDEVQRLF